MPQQLRAKSESAGSLTLKERQRRIDVSRKVVSIYSPSGQEGKLASFIYSELMERGLSPRIDAAGNVVCEIGSGPSSILLCGHMDTVPGELPVRVEGNVLYGRGACDAKGPLLSMLFAFEDIASEFGRRAGYAGKVIFAGVTEEERNSTGLNELVKEKVRADAAIFGEPCGVNKVTIGYRGHVPVSFEIETAEAHASAPWLTNNSAEVAFALYQALKESWKCGKPEQSTDCVSVALTEINAGSAHNVIPGKARLVLDIRLPLNLSSKEAVSQIESTVSRFRKEDVSIQVEYGEPTEPYKARLNSTLVRALNRSLIKSGYEKSSFVSKSGTGDMNTYAFAFGVDAVTYGPGDTKLSHTAAERVDIEEIFACSSILCGAAFEYFALDKRN